MTEEKKDFNDIKQMLVEMSQNASLVRTDPQLFDDPCNILYRLPLTNQQRQDLFDNIMKDYNDKKNLNDSIQQFKLSSLNSIIDVPTTQNFTA